ncbi:MAG: hypothetical protein OXF79_23280 [Chloroflexi bacterium]|nr:hypothetical protein [Chloroflexota bacterium]
MVNNFQKIGSVSNAHVGRDFENAAQEYFGQQGIGLRQGHGVQIGFSSKREHKFDLGADKPPTLVECKAHTWTSGGNVPSAKITVWNEAMLYFSLAPRDSHKILFVLRDWSAKRGESLAEYYVRTHGHLIPDDVEILEYDERNKSAVSVTGT